MASRKPLVMVGGLIQQLQSGDTLDAPVSEVDVVSMLNANVGALVIGTPVYVSAAGSVNKAKADAAGTSKVLGLVRDTSISSGASGSVQTDGILTATTGQWDAVTGGTGGLTAGSYYWVDTATAGKLTSTAPTTVGQYVIPVGLALSTIDLDITTEHPILL